MGELVVTPWERYGKNRAYVNTEGGQRVGWVDLDTGVQTLERPDLAAEFMEAVQAYLRHVAPTMAISQPMTEAVPLAPTPTAPESGVAAAGVYDLAWNRPGEAARQQAELELTAMKTRSRIGTAVARAFDMKTDERAWRVGADGEETVGARLEKLTAHGWHVLHAVPVGNRGSDIDHVLVGPGGVFTINTKNHPGKKIWVGKNSIRVDGHSVPYLRNARYEAERASRLLSEPVGFPVVVRPAIVFLTGGLIPNITIKQRPDDVIVLHRADVPRAFSKAPTRLTPEQVEWIYAFARRSTTWQP